MTLWNFSKGQLRPQRDSHCRVHIINFLDCSSFSLGLTNSSVIIFTSPAPAKNLALSSGCIFNHQCWDHIFFTISQVLFWFAYSLHFTWNIVHSKLDLKYKWEMWPLKVPIDCRMYHFSRPRSEHTWRYSINIVYLAHLVERIAWRSVKIFLASFCSVV